jgi:hypothetical protein
MKSKLFLLALLSSISISSYADINELNCYDMSFAPDEHGNYAEGSGSFNYRNDSDKTLKFTYTLLVCPPGAACEVKSAQGEAIPHATYVAPYLYAKAMTSTSAYGSYWIDVYYNVRGDITMDEHRRCVMTIR